LPLCQGLIFFYLEWENLWLKQDEVNYHEDCQDQRGPQHGDGDGQGMREEHKGTNIINFLVPNWANNWRGWLNTTDILEQNS
jgi:hypothetical protein